MSTRYYHYFGTNNAIPEFVLPKMESAVLRNLSTASSSNWNQARAPRSTIRVEQQLASCTATSYCRCRWLMAFRGPSAKAAAKPPASFNKPAASKPAAAGAINTNAANPQRAISPPHSARGSTSPTTQPRAPLGMYLLFCSHLSYFDCKSTKTHKLVLKMQKRKVFSRKYSMLNYC
jgi:hypothetical protein